MTEKCPNGDGRNFPQLMLRLIRSLVIHPRRDSAVGVFFQRQELPLDAVVFLVRSTDLAQALGVFKFPIEYINQANCNFQTYFLHGNNSLQLILSGGVFVRFLAGGFGSGQVGGLGSGTGLYISKHLHQDIAVLVCLPVVGFVLHLDTFPNLPHEEAQLKWLNLPSTSGPWG